MNAWSRNFHQHRPVRVWRRGLAEGAGGIHVEGDGPDAGRIEMKWRQHVQAAWPLALHVHDFLAPNDNDVERIW